MPRPRGEIVVAAAVSAAREHARRRGWGARGCLTAGQACLTPTIESAKVKGD